MSFTFELRPSTRHEELNGLNLVQVTVLMLFLRVAVGPACGSKKSHTVRSEFSHRPGQHKGITHITHERRFHNRCLTIHLQGLHPAAPDHGVLKNSQ